MKIPPCDHDACPPTGCLQVENARLQVQLAAATQRVKQADEFRERLAAKHRTTRDQLSEALAHVVQLRADKAKAEAEAMELRKMVPVVDETKTIAHSDFKVTTIKGPATCHKCRATFDSPTTGLVLNKCSLCGEEIKSDCGKGYVKDGVSKEELKPTIELFKALDEWFASSGYQIRKAVIAELFRLQKLMEVKR